MVIFFGVWGGGGGGGGEGIGGIFKEICQKFLGYPGCLYNWSLDPTSRQTFPVKLQTIKLSKLQTRPANYP